jgi:hypothetical protein
MWWEILRPAPGKWDVLFGRPVQMILLVTSDGDHQAALMQVDHLGQRVAVSPISGSVILADLVREDQPLQVEQLATRVQQLDKNRLAGLRGEVERSLDIEGLQVLYGTRELISTLLPAVDSGTLSPSKGAIGQVFKAWRATREGQLKTSLSLRSLLILMRNCRYRDISDEQQTRER